MSITTNSAVTPVDGSKYFGQTAVKAKSDLDLSTFLTLLTTQLQNQNPLEPMSDSDFFAQLAQMGSVQGIDSIKAALQQTQGASLLGKTVTAVRTMTDSGSDGMNSLVTGKVVRLTVKNGEQLLGVQESDGGIVDVKIGNIRQIEE